MMEKFKFLLKIMTDDLKDADMLMDYACELKEDETALATEFAKYAQSRLEHFVAYHKIFQSEAEKDSSGTTARSVPSCMWDEVHSMFLEWYEELERKIKKF